MKRYCFLLIAVLTGGELLFAQMMELAPGTRNQFAILLNKPTMVKPPVAAPLGKNWFRLETDVHVISDQVSAAQVTAALMDLEHQDSIYNGKKSKLQSKFVRIGADETVMDFVAISIIALGIQIKTPYRTSIKPLINTGKIFALELRQVPEDSASNKEIKNLIATRYVEEILINGKSYTYIRYYTVEEVNGSIIPGAKKILEDSSGPVNEEALQLIIAAAKVR